MSLLPATATFEELVQDCFLAHRGSGLMLSALDAELLSNWAAERIPFEVVARGIRRAAEAALWDCRPGEPALRSLRACRRQVEVEIRRYLGRAAGKTMGPSPLGAESGSAEPWFIARHKRLCTWLKKLAREHPPLTERATLLLSKLGAPPSDLAQADRREEWARAELLRALPFDERRAVLREAAQLAQNGAGISARARALSRRFHRGAVLAHRLQLPAL